MIHLPDVNVLLALAWSNHPHHEAAHRWFVSESLEGWATCLLTQGGLINAADELTAQGERQEIVYPSPRARGTACWQAVEHG